MTRKFDADRLVELGWRQGAILGRRLARLAWKHAPERVSEGENDYLVVTSHDCDIVNASIDREPVVEVLRARISDDPGGQRSHFSSGRNPRKLRLPETTVKGDNVVLELSVHDRWTIPRQLLMEEQPTRFLPISRCRLVAEWLAKRYIRSAFPTEFDYRWRGKSKAWRKLLRRQSSRIQGVYLRLHTLQELPADQPYKCALLLAVPQSEATRADWLETEKEIERAFTVFWDQLRPAIECEDVEVLTTGRITLVDIEQYQRFDADWISFEDETAVMPIGTAFSA